MNATFLSILRGALQSGASDIHIKPDAPVIFRVNRQLTPIEIPRPGEDWLNEVLSEIVPEHLKLRLEQEHEIDFALSVPGTGRFRVNLFKQRGRYTLAMRTVKTSVRALKDLNLPPVVARIAEAPRGIVLIAGAIGSGKSTTMAAMLEHINTTSRKHIITLEDPIEYLFEDKYSVIEQREIGLDTASFASGLRHVLRQDPDVLVIGEMRDAESAAAAMTAANIGHLVIATLHTADTTRSVQRILEFFPSTERDYARRLFADTLHAVICQRLIPDVNEGIVPAVEILINNLAVSKLISSDHSEKISGAIELGSNEGMQTFDHALQELVRIGRITKQKAIEHAASPEGLRMLFQGVVHTESRRILGSRD